MLTVGAAGGKEVEGGDLRVVRVGLVKVDDAVKAGAVKLL